MPDRYVWRLERAGAGAFRSAYQMKSLVDDADEKAPHGGCDYREPPEPDGETGALRKLWDDRRVRKSNYYFGFRSLKQYQRWFNTARFRDNLDQVGGELVRYRVPASKVYDGQWQVAFVMASATKVGSRKANAV